MSVTVSKKNFWLFHLNPMMYLTICFNAFHLILVNFVFFGLLQGEGCKSSHFKLST